MNVVVSIDGRDALPVWSIPYVTSGDIDAVSLLKKLMNPEYAIPYFPVAFNLYNNIPYLMRSGLWEETKNKIDIYANKFGDTPEGRNEWFNYSIDIIMQNEGCYIWVDEFKYWLERLPLDWNPIELNLNPTLSAKHALHFERELSLIAPYDKNVMNGGIDSQVNNESATEALVGRDTESLEDKPVKQRNGKNGKRDEDVAAWVKEANPNLEAMTNPQIKMALQARDATRKNKLWSNGFSDWNRGQKVYPKKKVGRKPK